MFVIRATEMKKLEEEEEGRKKIEIGRMQTAEAHPNAQTRLTSLRALRIGQCTEVSSGVVQ